jgi:hypothetical protein
VIFYSTYLKTTFKRGLNANPRSESNPLVVRRDPDFVVGDFMEVNIQASAHSLNYCVRCAINQGITRVVFSEELKNHMSKHNELKLGERARDLIERNLAYEMRDQLIGIAADGQTVLLGNTYSKEEIDRIEQYLRFYPAPENW